MVLEPIDSTVLEYRLRQASPRILVGGKSYTQDQIQDSFRLMRTLVQKAPDQAYNLFLGNKNRELGRIFVEFHRGTKDYGTQAWHVAQELRIPNVPMVSNPVRQSVEELEYKAFRGADRRLLF